MNKTDIILAIITGEAAAWFFYTMITDFGITISFLGLLLAIVFPILAIIGLWICYFIGKKFLWVFQIAKFMLIGVLATLVDLGILNFLMRFSGIASGPWYYVFKGVSFLLATISKYSGDKFWAFKKKETAGMGTEFGKFVLVTLGGLIINLGAAYIVVDVVGPQFGLAKELWGTIGGIAAAFATIIWNFVGYKYLVFKK